jgi:hypothetical protein
LEENAIQDEDLAKILEALGNSYRLKGLYIINNNIGPNSFNQLNKLL